MTQIWTDENVNGPNPYTTGGFVVATGLASVAFFSVTTRQAGSNLGQARFQITLNSPSPGSVTVKVLQQDYDKVTAVGSPTALPSGVSVRSTSGGQHDAVSHTHNYNHNHLVTPASTTPAGANAATLALALQPNATTHTHTVDVPLSTGLVTVAEAAHLHTWDSIYQHQHAITNTTTDLALVELANGTNLSTTKLNFLASDG